MCHGMRYRPAQPLEARQRPQPQSQGLAASRRASDARHLRPPYRRHRGQQRRLESAASPHRLRAWCKSSRVRTQQQPRLHPHPRGRQHPSRLQALRRRRRPATQPSSARRLGRSCEAPQRCSPVGRYSGDASPRGKPRVKRHHARDARGTLHHPCTLRDPRTAKSTSRSSQEDDQPPQGCGAMRAPRPRASPAHHATDR